MTPDDWQKLRVGDRLKEVEVDPSESFAALGNRSQVFFVRNHLWKVIRIESEGVHLWCSSVNIRRFFLRSEIIPWEIVWKEGDRAGTPKSIWELVSEEE